MPAPVNRGNVTRRSAFRLRGKSARSVDADVSRRSPCGDCGDLLQIGPAVGAPRKGLGPRAHSTLGARREPAAKLTNGQEQRQERERCDRISLDRRGLTSLPESLCSGEAWGGPRLLSLQHNLLSSLEGLGAPRLQGLVLLDLYDNQLQDIHCLETLSSLRVLLLGKNRIRKVDNLYGVSGKLEVLDLHGNRITLATGLGGLKELKVLNLAGNLLKVADLSGLPQLRELNLKRNRLRRVVGCDGSPRLQKLFLSNNDLQSIDDISSLAVASSLREVTLDNNPVALGGDCVPFLVSYLPTLNFISQMQVTDQVRRAAMAWRQNKEASVNTAFTELGEEADANARREQVISNARTNWELLRSQSKCFSSPTPSPTNPISSELILESNGILKSETPDLIKTTNFGQLSKISSANPHHKHNQKDIPRSLINNGIGEKRVNFSHRSISQDTDASHSTSTSSELLKLPPILVPIIDSLEHQKLTLNGAELTDKSAVKVLKRWESVSSVDPVMNSSLSSLPTTTSESDTEVTKVPQRRVQTAHKKRASFAASKSVTVSVAEPQAHAKVPFKNRSISDNSENTSVLSNGTNLNSNSSNDTASRNAKKEPLSRAGSAKSRHIRSATTARRSYPKQIQTRPVTAKPKPTKVADTAEVTKRDASQNETGVKEREQGGDWLVEVRGEEGSVWGAGALRRLEKSWPTAQDVTSLNFHYVSFGAICAQLSVIKNRFPNAVHFSFRACGVAVAGQLGALAALRGITSLSISREGNPLASRHWHPYALYRLAHWGLRSLDQQQMTDEDIASANAEYAGLSDVVLWSLPDTLLQPLLTRLQGDKDGTNTAKNIQDMDPVNGQTTDRRNFEKDAIVPQRRVLEREGSIQRRPLERENSVQRKVLDKDQNSARRPREKEVDILPAGAARAWLWNADPALRDVVAREALQWRRSVMSQEEVVLRHRGRTHLSRVLSHAADAAVKLKMLRRHWPTLLVLILTRILQDYAKMPEHIAKHMKELNNLVLEEGINKK